MPDIDDIWDDEEDRQGHVWDEAPRRSSVQETALASPADDPAFLRKEMLGLQSLLKEIYDAPTMEDGYRILRDWARQFWPADPVALSTARAVAPAPLPLGYIPMPDGLHSDTAKLVCAFAEALAAKLRLAEAKYGYSDGWRRDAWRDELVSKLVEHVHKGDPRDVAAYCAFAWFHGWSVTPTAQGMGWNGTLGSISASEEPGGPLTVTLTMDTPAPKWVTFQAVWDALRVEVRPLPSAPSTSAGEAK
ncbi:hypothetical protein TSH58p_17370 [Azospirillum sp. TSH58]|uniref:hypothetical protein n=1 Tax=Azospirillum sp. TSH58 TaxID=664962 RepID=UPI000D6003FB|nr:hypothetical protein [Azospirillum sp. TSH58]AWJ85135.1 hypothetical protein TSH58p_17370 [Azospirillum sp. TSH58]